MDCVASVPLLLNSAFSLHPSRCQYTFAVLCLILWRCTYWQEHIRPHFLKNEQRRRLSIIFPPHIDQFSQKHLSWNFLCTHLRFCNSITNQTLGRIFFSFSQPPVLQLTWKLKRCVVILHLSVLLCVSAAAGPLETDARIKNLRPHQASIEARILALLSQVIYGSLIDSTAICSRHNLTHQLASQQFRLSCSSFRKCQMSEKFSMESL